MIKNKYVAYILFIVVFLIFWNLLDFLYVTFISRNAYQFAAGTDLGIPVAAAVVVGYLLFIRKKSE